MRRCTVCRQASMKSAKDIVAYLHNPATRSEEELAFLPAALEIVETPAPPLVGVLGGTLIALFCLALVWACFGRIDIIASATGKIVPSGRTEGIPAVQPGVVRAIPVEDG